MSLSASTLVADVGARREEDHDEADEQHELRDQHHERHEDDQPDDRPPGRPPADQPLDQVVVRALHQPAAAARRASERSRPSSSSDSNSGGDTFRPVTAIRTGPNATRGLSSSFSMSASRRAASMSAVDHDSSAGERLVRRAYDVAAGVVELVDQRERRLVGAPELALGAREC